MPGVRAVFSVFVAAVATVAAATTGCGGRVPLYADPRTAAMTAEAPATYRVHLETTKGDVVIDATRAWAPLGADRFFNLVRSGFYDGQRISRVRPGFIAQWGLHTHPATIMAWKEAYLRDDPPREGNAKGTIAFAFKDPHTRSTQVYVNLVDNRQLDAQGFAPFGVVVQGMPAVEAWYGGYGENAGGGLRAGLQGPIEREGAAWLDREFPLLDRIIRARIVARP